MGPRQRLIPFGIVVGRIRRSIGQKQVDLGRRVGRSQSWVSRVERGALVTLTIAEADELCHALGATLVFGVEPPTLLGGERQRDAAHARCVAYVARRLARAGWHIEREVEIGDPQRPGWIDILAYDPSTRTLLVIEVKTQIVDVGALERQRLVRASRACGGPTPWLVPASGCGKRLHPRDGVQRSAAA